MSGRSVIISERLASDTLADTDFVARHPEFKAALAKRKVMRSGSSNCKGCSEKLISRNSLRYFVETLSGASREAIDELKSRYGADTLQARIWRHKLGKYELKVL